MQRFYSSIERNIVLHNPKLALLYSSPSVTETFVLNIVDVSFGTYIVKLKEFHRGKLNLIHMFLTKGTSSSVFDCIHDPQDACCVLHCFRGLTEQFIILNSSLSILPNGRRSDTER